MATEGLTAWRGYLYAVSFVALIVAVGDLQRGGLAAEDHPAEDFFGQLRLTRALQGRQKEVQGPVAINRGGQDRRQ